MLDTLRRWRNHRQGALESAVGRALRDAERSLADRWIAHRQVADKDGVVDLATMMELFLPRAGEVVREKHAAVAALPDVMLLGVVLKVVRASRTHSGQEIDAAVRALAVKLGAAREARRGASCEP